MAIYTQYGRYLKAKMFKEALESSGTTYMLLGLGNPQWDATNAQEMPVAPYDISSVMSDGQFNDLCISQWFQNQTANTIIPAWPNPDFSSSEGNAGAYLEECKNLQPIFPAIWQPSDDRVIFSSAENFTQSNYQTGYITEQDGAYTLYFGDGDSQSIDFNTLTDLEKQYFADLYLRGRARDIIINPGEAFENRLPVGLLGAVRCQIDFVEDIGFDDSNYTGSIDEFWYGDRYWKIVRPDDDTIIEDYVSTDSDNQKIFPHHLLINATLNPRTLCDNLIIDQAIVPRHIAIFTKHADSSTPPRYYRVYENVFNFGQYDEDESASISTVTNNGTAGTKLNFTLKTYSIKSTETYSTPKGEFTFWLHDYIHGQIRETHSIDRIGYVIGF